MESSGFFLGRLLISHCPARKTLSPIEPITRYAWCFLKMQSMHIRGIYNIYSINTFKMFFFFLNSSNTHTVISLSYTYIKDWEQDWDRFIKTEMRFYCEFCHTFALNPFNFLFYAFPYVCESKFHSDDTTNARTLINSQSAIPVIC